MARNYMRDITPPDEPRKPAKRSARSEPEAEPRIRQFDEQDPSERSIRTLRPSAARTRLTARPEQYVADAYASETNAFTPKPHKSRLGIWIAVGITVLVLSVVGLLVLFPATSVTVIPHTQVVAFDATMPFTAYPEASAPAGAIAYGVAKQSFEDSAVVQASGTEEAQTQAKGTVTVYNNYSDKPVALIKNTRFQTPDGLIFRIPVSIDVPGKKGNIPGSIDVEVFGDQAGPEYNVGPFERLVIPGLRSTAEMYEKVYAKSTTAFSGGFSGTRPAVAESVLEAAQADVRSRLQEKANQLAATAPSGTVAFPGLMAVSFQSLPPTEESGGVRINERINVSIPIFSGDNIARSIAQTVSASAEGQSVSIQFTNVTGTPAIPLSAADLGQQPFTFTLGGRGQLVWSVDIAALANALAGRDEAAFETVIAAFPAVEEARARLMPLWRSTFPEAKDIKITVEEAPQI